MCIRDSIEPELPEVSLMALFVAPSQRTQMVSMFYNLEHPMHIWDGMQQCYVTSHDEETNDE
eukprot:12926244-Prorocentrum_lima.AAC.1